MSMDNLIELPNKSEGSCLSLKQPNGFEFSIRFDGCVHVYDKSGLQQDNTIDYIHVCHLDEFIKLLQECQEKARKHFGEKWPN